LPLPAGTITERENPDALDYLFRARAAGWKPPSREKYVEQILLLERVLALDPQSIEAQSRLATALTGRVMDQMSSTIATDISRAEGLVRQALAASPRSPLAHFAKGQILRAQKRHAEAIPEYEMAIACDRNWVSAFGPLGECKLFAGEIDQIIPLHEHAIRLSPRDPMIAIWYVRIGIAHLVQSRIEEAVSWLEKARGAHPGLPYAHSYLAAAYGLRGETRRAATELAEARRLSSDNRYSSITALKASVGYGVPKVRAASR
jgi:tetratricopeptide (TPR) repeat protein